MVSVSHIGKTLEATGMLQKESSVSFSNADFFPWISIGIVHQKNNGYNQKDDIELANLIVIVGSRDNDEKQYLDLLLNIAKQLQWELVDEDSDEIIYKP